MPPSIFAYTFDGEPFRLFSPSHLLVLLLFAVLTAALFVYRKKWHSSSRLRNTLRHALAGTLLLTEISFQLWHLWTDSWSLAYSLPLQLCSVSLLLAVIMLFTKHHTLYEITFFAGIGGASLAMLTPELFYPFPHFRFFHFFLAHAAIIWACLFMTWVEGYRPSLRSVWKTMGFLNVLLLLALLVNDQTGGNYLFVSRKPENPTLLDYLGEYPWYILSLEGIALVVFLLLYLPTKEGKQAETSPAKEMSS